MASERQEIAKESERSMSIYKRDDMIQKGRHQLSLQEQRCVLYAISKIKPGDTALSEITFDIKQYYEVFGIKKESYTEMKEIIKSLRDRSWWTTLEDGSETAVSWFAKVKINRQSGKVTIRFDEDMMPYLLQLSAQGVYYTGYELRYILPMTSQYSPRLYELLKSYQKNNRRWFFDIDELKTRLNCTNYVNFADFRRYVLKKAIEEINAYTDFKIDYRLTKEGRKVVRVEFFFVEKNDEELLETKLAIKEKLDGDQYTLFDPLGE